MPPLSKWQKCYMGIDPGSKGAIAVLGEEFGISIFKLNNTTLHDLWKFLGSFSQLVQGGLRLYAVLEHVGGYMKRDEEKDQGGEQPGSSMFNFGASAGALEMALVAMGLYEDSTYRKVRPQQWQRALGVPTRKPRQPKNTHKNMLKDHAQSLFGQEIKVTLDNADALLLAEYCRRQQEGTL